MLEEQSGKEVNGSMYNGGGLGLKGSSACRRSTAGFEEVSRFEESSKCSKGLQSIRRDIEGSKEASKRFEGDQGLRGRLRGLRRGVP